MPIARLPPRLEGKTLLQVTDLHVGPIVDQSYIEGALTRAANLRPDLVVVTGDLMTCWKDEQIPLTAQTIKLLRPERQPVIAIPGNHDYGQSFRDTDVAEMLGAELLPLGVRWLRNECEEFYGLQIAGTDDLWSGRLDLRKTIGAIDRSKAAIVLTHNPDGVDQPAELWGGYRGWVLAGHTHGGQFRIPGIGALLAPINNYRYVAGKIDLQDGRILYVNRGLGYKQRIRLFTRPEITLFHLTAAKV